MDDKPFVIVMVDDDEDDRYLFQEVVDSDCPDCQLLTFGSGDAFLAYLPQAHPLPTLILLDLNLPRQDGLQILKLLSEDNHWQPVPVIIYTDSEDEAQILQCYRSYANAVINKPPGIEAIRKLMRSIRQFWFHSVTLPVI
jgi:CheY-like chemotaxis protein